ncbi:CesT family type III secretion system chaperone [Pseudovibrio sp. Ad26]|uniref:CesT family type III secretion system chaperone n=1 Tax=Pseudovibrio sp. Ad26 TaxID=989410 RepID=UPI0007AED76B|nr:CesT family type III secretion system chaperone [Pseudovibrio sp. Ad26]KZK96762.1 Tir chaperone protein (CesT) [Pseudovibrio sp. Ad26]
MDSNNLNFHHLMKDLMRQYLINEYEENEVYQVDVDGSLSMYFVGNERDYIKLLVRVDREAIHESLSDSSMLKLNLPDQSGHPIIVGQGDDDSVVLWSRIALSGLSLPDLLESVEALGSAASSITAQN